MATPFVRTTRALAADSGRPALWAWALALLLGAAWLGWFTLGRVTVYEVSQQARIEAVQTAHAVSALQGGALASSQLQLGRVVKAGELLAELDSRAAALRLREESQRLAALRPRQAALRDEISTLQAAGRSDTQAAAAAVQTATARAAETTAQLDFAREHEKRLAAEAAAGGVPEIDALRARSETRRLQAVHDALLADARRLTAEAQARDAQTRSRIDALKGQLATLDGDAATLTAGVARLQADMERLRVRAPVDGTLADVAPVSTGTWVAEGQRLATVLPRGALRVVADFAPATALGRVRPGQAARLRLDGFPWAQHGSLSAQVQRVAGEVRDQRLRVELLLDPAASAGGLALQHGLSGSVEVALEDVSPALLLLRSMGQRLDAPAPPRAATALTASAAP